MQLAKDLHNFTSACERLLASETIYRPLTDDEIRLVGFYCQELPQKLVSPRTDPPR